MVQHLPLQGISAHMLADPRAHEHTRIDTRVYACTRRAHAHVHRQKVIRWYMTVGRHVNSFETHGRA